MTTEILLIIYWISWSALLSIAGSQRTIGWVNTLLISLIFSPIAGAVGVALSQLNQPDPKLTAKKLDMDELNKVQNAYDRREITSEEYNKRMKELQG